ncbi:aldehyde oxidase isoform X2 [Protobothrops mucrosquamatus]|uniref:aldehyde oxidase isoform X2 n=1 Tax=Protobothrops mucrosquamatus TaxID=103944 RepID=UPI000775D72E|nr:aldehyde oxidase isoform X2 [Protobothrops mucrosquamatus]
MTCPQPSDELVFFVNGRKVIENYPNPEEYLLNYLRKELHLTGTKYGCGIGGCGACTVMISTYNPETKKIHHYPANSCLLPLCSIHGAAITTVEGVGTTKTKLNPIQERLAKCFGSQCGFCTPGMVMSMYSLLRNHPEPSMEQIVASLDGNLCRCTGYRPIMDSFSAFSSECCPLAGSGKCCMEKEKKLKCNNIAGIPMCSGLCKPEKFYPRDPTQDYIFPPELMRMAEENRRKTLVFNGNRTTWISPASLKELLQLKATYLQAPLVIGNTSVGLDRKLLDVYHPLFLHPVRVPELHVTSIKDNGILIGAATSFAQLRDFLLSIVSELPTEKTKIYCTLLKQLRTLAGEQIRSLASLGGHIVSRGSTWDLNPVLAAGKAILYVASEGGTREIPLNDEFLERMPQADLLENEVIVSVFIPFSKENEFVSAFRQADRRRNALSVTNSAMKVLFESGTDVIQDLSILYGGIDCTTVSARNSCQKLIGRNWNEQMLNEACKLILEEITLSPSAPGGKVEYRRTMLISFFFRFYLKVLHNLRNMFPYKYPDLPKEYMSALDEFYDIPPKGIQTYQGVNPQQPPQDPVGRPIKHESGIKHATGEAVYVDDMEPAEGQLYMAVVTSTRAHAKILAIDISEALKEPGVVDIVTAQDIPGKNGDGKEDVFAEDEVIFIGHIICGVVATSFECAKQAAKKVKIDYQDLEVILTIEEAINHESFLVKDKKIERGNVEKAFQTVDKIVEGEVHIGGQEHFYLETNSVCVIPRKEDNTMDIYVSTQDAAHVQDLVASVLDVQSNKIMCHTKRVGGGFGGKATKPPFFAAAAAVAAKKTACPVRFILERQDDMLVFGGRHPLYGKYKVGFMKDGKIEAVDLLLFINGGCSPDETELVIDYVVLKSCNAYDIPNFRSKGWACKTNLPSNTAFRGFGFAQSALSAEMWIAVVADSLDLPPDKVREMNLYKTVSEMPFKEKVDARNLLACWKECLKKSDYYIRKEAAEEFNKQNYWKKKGIAIIPMLFSVGYNDTFYHQAAALVHIYVDGSVLLSHGGAEMGQGLYTKMLQVASHELKIPLSYIHQYERTTVTIPNAIATGGSIGADVNGKAVQNACQILRKRLEPIIKKNPKGKWEDWIKTAHEESISLSATGFFKGYVVNMDWEKGEGHAFSYFIFGASCSEVEIDCLTGDHKNLRTDIVMDGSFSINPGIDIGQVEGGFIQGLGLYTTEEIKFSPEGQQYTLGPDTYKIPGLCDIPEDIRTYLLPNSRNPIAIYSSRGLGESGVFLGSSVFFAIRDAIGAARKERGLNSVFTLDSPLNVERIRMACADYFTEMIPRDKPGTYKPWAIQVD